MYKYLYHVVLRLSGYPFVALQETFEYVAPHNFILDFIILFRVYYTLTIVSGVMTRDTFVD